MSTRIALGGPRREAAERAVVRLVEQRVASRVTAQDASVLLVGAAVSLAWTESVADAVPLIDQIRAVRHTLRHEHLRRAVVLQPTGATLAAAMIARTAGLEVDSDVADPGGAVLVEFAADRAAVRRAVDGADLGSIEFETASSGADGALSAASLVPAGLAGADLREILDEAQTEMATLAADDPGNPGLLLGAAIAAAEGGVEVVADGTHIVGFPVWAARLLAETLQGVAPDPSTGEGSASAGVGLRIRLVEDAADADPGDDVLLSGTLGELILLWQYAAVVALIVGSSAA